MEKRCVVPALWARIIEDSDPCECSLPLNPVAFENSIIRSAVESIFAKYLSHLDRPYLIG